MKFSYRITKYHQYLGDENQTLTSPAHEWTSFGDIDKGLVTLADYEAVEQAYIQTISAICRHLNVDYLKIKKLSDFNGLKQYRNNQRIRADEGLTCLLRLILREKMWCKLKSRRCEFYFGYDYYLYCVSNKNLSDLFASTSTILNIEGFVSPYLERKQLVRVLPF